MVLSHLNHENKKIEHQNQLNSLSSSMKQRSLSRQSRKRSFVRSVSNLSKRRTSKKKGPRTVSPKRSSYNRYQMRIHAMKQMNDMNIRKQNEIIYLSRSILNDQSLDLNEKNTLMNQI